MGSYGRGRSIERIAWSSAETAALEEALVEIWNDACGPDLAISTRLLKYNVAPVPGVEKFGWITRSEHGIDGFVLASHSAAPGKTDRGPTGWIDALAVRSDARSRGVGSGLLDAAEAMLLEAGCRQASLGGSLRPFAPGLPAALSSTSFFSQRGYQPVGTDDESNGRVWDVAADLAGYDRAGAAGEAPCAVLPARPADRSLLLAFLKVEFPGRWHFECEDYLRTGGRLSDYMLAFTEQGVEGFCRLAFEDSLQPLERFYPYGLRRPWGQLGPIGVGKSARGKGVGAALMHAGLRRLHNNGVNGCVIDWTTLLDFYARFSFQPYREYLLLAKSLP